MHGYHRCCLYISYVIVSVCRSLVKLNLAYNQIQDLSGLQSVHGPDYRLSQLDLHGNQLQSLPHVTRCVLGCVNLRHLTLAQSGADNPICNDQGVIYELNVKNIMHVKL